MCCSAVHGSIQIFMHACMHMPFLTLSVCHYVLYKLE